MDLDEITEELYALALTEFTATRNARAAEARKEGDRQLAQAVASLKKPTLAAWAVNRLARRRSHEVSRFLDLGPALREAQQALAGDAIRTLSRQRQQAVMALVEKARSLVEEAGQRLTVVGRADVEQVLEQALADPVLADTVRQGRLTTTAGRAAGGGFGLDRQLDATAPQKPSPRARAAPSDLAQRRQRDLSDAKRRALEARRTREQAEKALERIRVRVAQAEENLVALRARERSASDALRKARQRERSMEQVENRAEAAARRTQS